MLLVFKVYLGIIFLPPIFFLDWTNPWKILERWDFSQTFPPFLVSSSSDFAVPYYCKVATFGTTCTLVRTCIRSTSSANYREDDRWDNIHLIAALLIPDIYTKEWSSHWKNIWLSRNLNPDLPIAGQVCYPVIPSSHFLRANIGMGFTEQGVDVTSPHCSTCAGDRAN